MTAEDRSDGALFKQIAAGGPEATKAQQMLYERHIDYLSKVLGKQRDRLLSLAGVNVEDLVQDTFQRAFDRAATFKAADVEEEHARRRTRAWLGRIAQNLIADGFRRFREVSATPYLERVTVPAVDESAPERPDLDRIREAMERLSDREQDILRVSALYYKASGAERLPNDVSAELCHRWGISNDNVRAIRSRAMKKLRRAMETDR